MVASLAEAKSHPVTPENFLKLHRDMAEAKREHEDTGAAVARAKKQAKSGAVDLDAYKFIEKLRKMEEDEQVIILRNIILYANWLEMPVGTQFSLLDAPRVPPVKTKARQEHSVWDAGEAGLRAGRDGEPVSANPFVDGTEQHVAFAKKHREGLTERATAARMNDDDFDAGPVADKAPATAMPGAKRGRPRGSRNSRPANGDVNFGNGGQQSSIPPIH